MPRRKAKDSEVHAYQFIKDELKLLGWDVRNPERADAGQVWTQHEALHNPAINESLKGRVPENVVKVTSGVLWIFEAKPSHQGLERALKEAEEYAQGFEGNRTYQARFISGVAGNCRPSAIMGHQMSTPIVHGKCLTAGSGQGVRGSRSGTS